MDFASVGGGYSSAPHFPKLHKFKKNLSHYVNIKRLYESKALECASNKEFEVNFVVMSLIIIVSVALWFIKRFEERGLRKESYNVVIIAIIIWSVILIIDGNIRESNAIKMMQSYHECVIVGILDENETLQEAEQGCKEFWLD